jgi:hydroxyacylglutathione hydrolase
MTRDIHDEDRREPQAEREPPEEESVEGPEHPGWLTLAQVFQTSDPFFEKFLFLRAYEYSSNIYLIRGENNFTLVDPGNDYTALRDLFRLELCKPEEIKKIALTHGHRDHCSGVFDLLRAYPHIVDSGGFELILHKESPQELKKVVKKFNCTVTELVGGEIIDLGGLPWEVIYTPGHTIDGLSFYHAPSKTAFTGDMAIPHNFAELDAKAGGRLDHYLYGVKALLKKDIDNVLPGHGFPVAEYGKRVIEMTYETVMMKILGSEEKIPWISGAEALARQGLLEEAVFCCDKALAANPDNMRGLQLKAMCLTDSGRGEEALQVLDVILARQSQDPYALTAKGHTLLGMGRYEESIEYFDRSLGIAPFIKETQVYKGMALYLSGRVDEAMDLEAFRSEFASQFKEEMEKLTEEQKK